MHFSTTFFVSAFAAMASAQNMFTMPSLPASIAVGSTFNITWQPTTQGSVSLLLVQASSPGSTLVHEVSTIAANITNSGAFAWIPSSLTPKGSGYAIEIVDDSNPYITNYSGQFAIDSNTIASSSASSSAPSSTASVSGNSTSASAASSSTGSMSSSSGSMTSSMTTALTTMSTMTSSGTSSASSTTSSPTTSAKAAGAAVETSRSGLALMVVVGVAVLAL